MKKNLVAILSMLLICSMGFSFGKKSKENYVRGTIAYRGNEPFVTMVIKADDGNVYKIKGDEKLLRKLAKEFGKKIQFYGELEIQEKKQNSFQTYNGTFKLEYFKVFK